MKAAFLARDKSLRGVTKCGRFRITAVSTTNLLRETISRHSTLALPGGGEPLETDNGDANESPSAMARCWNPRVHLPLLGNLISLTNLMATWMDREERVHAQFFVPTPPAASNATSADMENDFSAQSDSFASLLCESLALGETRAFANRAATEFGNVLKVQRIMYNKTEPVLSATKSPIRIPFPPVPAAQGNGSGTAASALLVPHAQFFLEQSDGIPTAAFLVSALEFRQEDEHAPEGKSGTAASQDDGAAAPVVRVDVPYSAGILLQPIASSVAEGSAEIDSFVQTRCRKLEKLAAALQQQQLGTGDAAEATIEARLLSVLHHRAVTHGLLLHDLVGLLTQDWAGASAACDKVRHASSHVENTALVQRLAAEFWASGLDAEQQAAEAKHSSMQIDIDSVSRTPLDFFCRCSKASDFLDYLKGMQTAERALAFLAESNDDGGASATEFTETQYTCAFCNSQFTITRADVEKLFATPPAQQ